jgi:ferredoxin
LKAIASMAVSTKPVAILLDADLSRTGNGLDLEIIVSRLSEIDELLEIAVIDDLERNPDQLSYAVAELEPERVILGLPGLRDREPEIQQAAREAGIDQLGIWPVALGVFSCRVSDADERTDHALLSLIGAIARVRNFGGSRQRNLRLERTTDFSLQTLLSLPEIVYRPAPTVRQDRCYAARGCRQCVENCPHNALGIADGQVRLRKQDCASCGICLTACPHDAINFPSAMPAEIHSQVHTLLDEQYAGADARGILFVCPNTMRNLARRNFELAPGWHAIDVPCLGMLTAQWLLAPLRLGAGAVGLVPCITDCRSGRIDLLRQRVSYCQALLRDGWDMPEAVQLAPTGEAGLRSFLNDDIAFAGFAFESEPDNAFDYRERIDVVMDVALADGAGTDWTITHPASPFAMARTTDGCTLCGSCAAACPTNALQIKGDQTSETSLTFDPTHCVVCEACLPACPEPNVLSVSQVTDFGQLEAGRTTLRADTIRRCERCGSKISSDRMMNRIAELLGEEHMGTMNVISRYCTDCRSLAS